MSVELGVELCEIEFDEGKVKRSEIQSRMVDQSQE